jgi:hydroxyethylthiazole kinase-like sugar kinase family protein
MEEHGQFDPNIRKQAEAFESSVPDAKKEAFGRPQMEQSPDAVQRLLEQAKAFDPNVGQIRSAEGNVADHRAQAARELYKKAVQLDPDKVAQFEAEQQRREEEAA